MTKRHSYDQLYRDEDRDEPLLCVKCRIGETVFMHDPATHPKPYCEEGGWATTTYCEACCPFKA